MWRHTNPAQPEPVEGRKPPMTVAEALREAAAALAASSDTPRLDAELLMALAMGKSRSDILLRHMHDTPPKTFAAMIERRMAHEPVAYILGRQEFYGLEFRVTRETLIPRADSELLVAIAIAARPDALSILDCGTGTGALLLATLTGIPSASGIGIDISAKALDVADHNVWALKLAHRTGLIEADWTARGWTKKLRGKQFDLILANPPYVEDNADLAPSVRDYEPAGALFAGPQGLDAYRVLVPQLPALLAPGGIALVEIGSRQAEAVSAIARAAGMAVRLHRDLADRPRALELSAEIRESRNISLGNGPHDH